MPVEINGSNLPTHTVKGNNTGVQEKAKAGSSHISAAQERKDLTPTNDNISLSQTATKLQELASEIAAQPVTDPQRVESISRLLESGSYRVDPDRIAMKLLSFESSLGTKQK
jgi:negative regulator of flagellin synthesis FlgM